MIDIDPTVADLEARVLDGDATVTPDDLAAAHTAAAGRSRFAQLRSQAADRRAAQAAEQRERDQAAAAAAHARAVLAPYTPAALVPVYDHAVAGLRAYLDALGARSGELAALAALPPGQRPRDLVDHQPGWGPIPPELQLDGHRFAVEDIAEHVRQILGAVGLGATTLRPCPPDQCVDGADPAVVAEGRAQLRDGAA